MNAKRLTKSNDRILMGVCGGLAEYWHTDAWIVRLVCALLIIAHPPLALDYLLFGIILPSPERSFLDEGNAFASGDTTADEWIDEPEAGQSGQQQNVFLGVLLITMGLIFLADYYFHWSWASIRKLWPVFLIIFGIKFLMDARASENQNTVSGTENPESGISHEDVQNESRQQNHQDHEK